MKILFTGGGGAGNEAIWRHLKKRYDVYFADSEIENISNLIPQQRKIKILPANNKNFISNIKNIIKKLKIDILVPSVDEELVKLSDLKNNKNEIKIIIPNKIFIKKMINKYDCFDYLKNKNIKIPETFYYDKNKSIKFPVIAKPTIGRGSRSVEKLNNKQEIENYNKIKKKNFIIQKFIEGREYTVFVFSIKKENILDIIPVKVLKKKGITIVGISEKNKKIESYVRNFDNKFDANGPYNLQCIQKKNGEVFLIEINPRISTTFCLILKSGFNFKKFINPLSKNKILIKKVKLERYWNNYFY